MQLTMQQEAMRQERRKQHASSDMVIANFEYDAAAVRRELALIRNDVLAELRKEDV